MVLQLGKFNLLFFQDASKIYHDQRVYKKNYYLINHFAFTPLFLRRWIFCFKQNVFIVFPTKLTFNHLL